MRNGSGGSGGSGAGRGGGGRCRVCGAAPCLAGAKRCRKQAVVPAVGAGENVARLSSGSSFLYCGPLISPVVQEEGRKAWFWP